MWKFQIPINSLQLIKILWNHRCAKKKNDLPKQYLKMSSLFDLSILVTIYY